MLTLIPEQQYAVVDRLSGQCLSIHHTRYEAGLHCPKVQADLPYPHLVGHPDFDVLAVRVTAEELASPAPESQLAFLEPIREPAGCVQ